jgi:hypothetical protein
VITPGQLRDKARRLYPQFVKAWLKGENFFPRRVPADLTLPGDPAAAKKAVDALRLSARESNGRGYSIEWQERNSRSHSLNRFPVAIQIESQDDLLYLADTKSEFNALEAAVDRLRLNQPRLDGWLLQSTHWKDLLKAARRVDDLLLMTQYLLDHPRPDSFAREIPLPVSTKLIEENDKLLSAWLDILLPDDQIDFRFDRDEFDRRYGLRHSRPHILVRVLDPALQMKMGLPFQELSIPADSIGRIQPAPATVFVVENKVNLLTLPLVKGGMAIGALGKAVSLLRDVQWLNGATIYYWGDFDVEGFEMLSQFRSLFEHTKSLLMDIGTYQRHHDLAIDWPNKPHSNPTALNTSERAVYDKLLNERKRLEQERLPPSDVVSTFCNLGPL